MVESLKHLRIVYPTPHSEHEKSLMEDLREKVRTITGDAEEASGDNVKELSYAFSTCGLEMTVQGEQIFVTPEKEEEPPFTEHHDVEPIWFGVDNETGKVISLKKGEINK